MQIRRRILGLFFLTSGAVAAATAGCAAGDEPTSAEQTEEPALPAEPSPKLPPPSNPGSDTDDGEVMASSPDGGQDAGPKSPPTPAPGQPCTVIDQIFTRACGACGKQTALCLAEDGGAPKVSEYSACAGEVNGGCIAGTVEEVPCGNCGTQKRTCDATCKWFTAACVQPQGACKAGTVEYTVAGCPTKNTYRSRSCSASCGWSAYGACLEPANETVIEVNPTVAQSNTASVTLSTSQMAGAIPSGGSCPAATILAGNYPYAYVEIRNTTSTQATVRVTTATPAGGKFISTQLAGYKVPFVPSGDEARKTCDFGPSSSLSGIVVEPGTSVLVYLRAWYEYDAANPTQSTGIVNVNVRTEKLL